MFTDDKKIGMYVKFLGIFVTEFEFDDNFSDSHIPLSSPTPPSASLNCRTHWLQRQKYVSIIIAVHRTGILMPFTNTQADDQLDTWGNGKAKCVKTIKHRHTY